MLKMPEKEGGRYVQGYVPDSSVRGNYLLSVPGRDHAGNNPPVSTDRRRVRSA